MHFLTVLVLSSSLLLLNSCQPAKKQQRQSSRELPSGIVDSKPAAKPATPAKEVWIDCRTPEEFATGHIVGAINISHTEFETQLPKMVSDKSTPLRLYCQSGGRSGLALKTAEKLGYENASNVGGYQDAQEAIKKD